MQQIHWSYLVVPYRPEARGLAEQWGSLLECSEVTSSNMTHVGVGPELLGMVFVSNSTVSPTPRNYRSQNQCGSRSGPSHSWICTIFCFLFPKQWALPVRGPNSHQGRTVLGNTVTSALNRKLWLPPGPFMLLMWGAPNSQKGHSILHYHTSQGHSSW